MPIRTTITVPTVRHTQNLELFWHRILCALSLLARREPRHQRRRRHVFGGLRHTVGYSMVRYGWLLLFAGWLLFALLWLFSSVDCCVAPLICCVSSLSVCHQDDGSSCFYGLLLANRLLIVSSAIEMTVALFTLAFLRIFACFLLCGSHVFFAALSSSAETMIVLDFVACCCFGCCWYMKLLCPVVNNQQHWDEIWPLFPLFFFLFFRMVVALWPLSIVTMATNGDPACWLSVILCFVVGCCFQFFCSRHLSSSGDLPGLVAIYEHLYWLIAVYFCYAR